MTAVPPPVGTESGREWWQGMLSQVTYWSCRPCANREIPIEPTSGCAWCDGAVSHSAALAALPAPVCEGETFTEWGVRWEDGETTSAGWMLGSESFARMSFQPRRGGRIITERQPEALVRRERIVYPDRVGEWTEATP